MLYLYRYNDTSFHSSFSRAAKDEDGRGKQYIWKEVNLRKEEEFYFVRRLPKKILVSR